VQVGIYMRSRRTSQYRNQLAGRNSGVTSLTANGVKNTADRDVIIICHCLIY